MPFNRFRTAEGRNVDTVLGPEMKSTGEVMGFDADFGTAFAKAQAAAYGSLPTTGRIFVSVANRDKRNMIFPVKQLADTRLRDPRDHGHRRGAAPQRRVGHRGPQALRGRGPGRARRRSSSSSTTARSTWSSTRPTPPAAPPRLDGYEIRTAAVLADIPCITTVQGLGAAVQGIEAMPRGEIGVRTLQDWQRGRTARLMGRPYRLLFDHVLTRIDPERIHHAAFRAIRAAAPLDPAAAGRHRASRSRRWGCASRTRSGSRPASTRTPSASTRSARSASATSRSARSPGRPSRATRGRGCSGCPTTGRSSTGWASTTTAPRWWPPGWPAAAVPQDGAGPRASTSARPRWCPRRRRSPTTRSRPACSPRTPTTSSSTSPRPTPRACATCRRWRSSSRCSRAVRRRADQVRPDDRVPLLVKIAPDLSDDDVLAVADLARGHRPRRDHRHQHHDHPRPACAPTPRRVEAVGAGGLSGAPLRARATEVVRLLRSRVGPDLTLVGVGGITTVDDARERLAAGADLVQGYTAFVYEGRAAGRAPSSRGSPPHDVRRQRCLRRPRSGPRRRRGARDQAGRRLPPPDDHRARRARALPRRQLRGGQRRRRAPRPPPAVDPPGQGDRRLRPDPRRGGRAPRARAAPGWPRSRSAPGCPSPARSAGPSRCPREPVSCVLVGEGYAAAPLFPLADRLRERGCPVTLVLAADDEAHLLSALEARRTARSVTVVTRDGSVGARGDVPPRSTPCWSAPTPTSSTPPARAPPCAAVAAAAERARRVEPGGGRDRRCPAAPACATAARSRWSPRTASPGASAPASTGPVIRGDRVHWGELG